MGHKHSSFFEIPDRNIFQGYPICGVSNDDPIVFVTWILENNAIITDEGNTWLVDSKAFAVGTCLNLYCATGISVIDHYLYRAAGVHHKLWGFGYCLA